MNRVHFVAIGGSAMHNLALALHHAGAHITGSDDEIFEPSKGRLKRYGLLPKEEGWFPEKITKELDAVILGMHARKDNPELKRAEELGLQVFSYPEYLYQHAKDKKRIVIGGSHGKTTTTAMILHVLQHGGVSVDYMVGAQLEGFDTMVKLTDEADYMVLEGDEYLTSPIDSRPKFHLYRPHAAVITGISWDHMNVFPTFKNYLEQFSKFIDIIEPGGTLIPCYEDTDVKTLVENHPRRDLSVIPYGVPDYSATDGKVTIRHKGEHYQLRIFGKHNLMNLEAARLVCQEVGISDSSFFIAMQSFEGASGRLEKVLETESQVVFRDFAHAPSKLKATLEAVRENYPTKKLVAVMELHTFSSLNKDFLPQYRNTMRAADKKVVFFLPHTLEMKKLPALDEGQVKSFFDDEEITVITDRKTLETYLKSNAGNNAITLLMSSGNLGGLKFEDIFIE